MSSGERGLLSQLGDRRQKRGARGHSGPEDCGGEGHSSLGGGGHFGEAGWETETPMQAGVWQEP